MHLIFMMSPVVKELSEETENVYAEDFQTISWLFFDSFFTILWQFYCLE